MHRYTSIRPRADEWVGVQMKAARTLGLPNISAFRHAFSMLAALVQDTYGRLKPKRRALVDATVILLSTQSAIRQEGLPATRRWLAADMRAAGRLDAAELVETAPAVELAMLIELARWRAAYGDLPYGDGIKGWNKGN